MYQIIDGRGTGKTSRLMLIAKETGATIVCRHPRAMQQKAYAYGITGVDFISYQDVFLQDLNKKKVLFDEIELFVQYCTNGKLIGYSLSLEENNANQS